MAERTLSNALEGGALGKLTAASVATAVVLISVLSACGPTVDSLEDMTPARPGRQLQGHLTTTAAQP
jgi:hypothetical protein